VWPDGPDRSAEEAHRRALRKLVAAGLVETTPTTATFLDDEAREMPKWAKAERARSRYWMWGRKRQAVKLTPLGERVVETHRDELETGRPVRWAKHMGALEAAVRRPLGELFDLLDRGAIGGALFSAGVGTAFARDPARKEQMARKQAALEKTRDVVREMAANTDTTVGGEPRNRVNGINREEMYLDGDREGPGPSFAGRGDQPGAPRV
jgi:hypothetical protein